MINFQFPISNFQIIKFLKFGAWCLFGIYFLVFGILSAQAHLSGDHNIDTNNDGYYWAWNDVVGWIGFHANNTVEVRANEIRGWADSSVGAIVFNCATTPNGDICDGSNGNFKVNNDKGSLSGWAWNDVIGWISFDCQDIGVCGGAPYQATIEPAGDGENSFFKGWAWSEIVGWVSFDCDNDHDPDTAGIQSVCSSFSTYRIQTDAGAKPAEGVLESNVFDTGSNNPVFNYILWRGTPKTGTSVQFQIAASSSSTGPWNFDTPVAAKVDERIPIDSQHQNKRYIKYRVLISSDNWREDTPIIDDIIINYSP